MIVYQHKAARIDQAFDTGMTHGVDAGKCRQHHGMLEGQLMFFLILAFVIDFGNKHHAVFDFIDLGIGDPFDMLVAQGAFQHASGVADAAQAQMPDIRFCGHKRHRYFIADFAFTQFGFQYHQVFIRRAVTGGALYRADNNGAWIFHKFVPILRGNRGMIDMADGGGITVRP